MWFVTKQNISEFTLNDLHFWVYGNGSQKVTSFMTFLFLFYGGTNGCTVMPRAFKQKQTRKANFKTKYKIMKLNLRSL